MIKLNRTTPHECVCKSEEIRAVAVNQITGELGKVVRASLSYFLKLRAMQNSHGRGERVERQWLTPGIQLLRRQRSRGSRFEASPGK
jgi:hypothetical protein